MPTDVLVPPFPLLGEPGAWDVLTLVAATIFLEAQDEPWEGLLGVGYVIRRRAVDWTLGWHGAVLGPDQRAYDDGRDFEPYSCWNSDYRGRALARLSTATPAMAEPSWKAGAAALWALLPDPVNGATFYLRLDATRTMRGGTLPAWAADPADVTQVDASKVTAVIGHHHFLRA